VDLPEPFLDREGMAEARREMIHVSTSAGFYRCSRGRWVTAAPMPIKSLLEPDCTVPSVNCPKLLDCDPEVIPK
jgi:hypothetical protein